MMNIEDKHMNILLVEDNPMDAVMTIESIKECEFANDIQHVTGGDEALEYLRQRGKYAAWKKPDLILLDLNLPGTDGFAVLQQIKTDDELKTIPVCILTSSEMEEDILRSYRLRANAYIPKPGTPEGFNQAIKSIKEFWLGIVALPTGT
jgi:CheY-like chemotaxis protein